VEGPVAEIVTRNWGVLITLVGAMLIYGAFRPEQRPLVLVVAGASKLTQGSRYLSEQVGVAIAVDAVMVLLFALYLLSGRRPENAVP